MFSYRNRVLRRQLQVNINSCFLKSLPKRYRSVTDRRCIPEGARARLRLLATTDLHMNLTSHDYHADRPNPAVGLTRTASLIHKARQEAAAQGALVLLFDNGDALQGTPLSDLAAAQPDRDHPLMRAFGHLHYDAIGLGNHDFNFGLKSLDSILQQAPCPVLSSNMRRLGKGKPAGFEPFAILDRMVCTKDGEWPIRIGVLSFLPPQTLRWDAHHLLGRVETSAIVDTARRWLPELQDAGCDLIVALAHTGLSDAPDHAELENAARPLAELDGIDVVVSGHTHLRLPGPDHCGLENVDSVTGAVHGKPVVMPGTGGSHLGIIDLDLTVTPNQRWAPAGFCCELRAIARRTTCGKVEPLVQEDPALLDLFSDDHHQTRALMNLPAGSSRQSLHSFFTFFAPDRSLALVAAAQAAALRPMLAATPFSDLPVLSATAPGKFGARAGPDHYTDVPAGPLSRRHVADLHVFPNELRALVVSGQQLLDWLEMTASLFFQIKAGKPGQYLVNPAMPGHDFDVVHGLTYEIDLAAPARYLPDGTIRPGDNRRIRNARCAGRPVAQADRFVVALNSYRASGGGPFGMLAEAQGIDLPAIALSDVIHDYVSGKLPPDPLQDAPPPWSFTPMKGTVVIARTGPGAMAHEAEMRRLGLSARGSSPDGFLELDVPL